MKIPDHLKIATEAELEQLAEAIDAHPDWYSVTRAQVDAALFQLRHKAQPPSGWWTVDSTPPPDGTAVLCWRRHPSDITRGQFFVASAWGRGRGAGRYLEWILEVGTEYDSTTPHPEPTHWASFPLPPFDKSPRNVHTVPVISDNQTPHEYTTGDRVRILKPAAGVPETARFIGTLGTVKVGGYGDLFVEPDAAPDFANSWWYGGDEIEFVESAPPPPADPGWYVVSEWCDDDYHHSPARLVWSTSEVEACRSAGCTFDGHEPKARRIELPASPTLGDRVSLD